MAEETVNEQTELAAAPASNDYIPIWDTSAGAYKRISKANFSGGTMTGAGTVATGGYTLTVPATGTAALLGTAQTFSALKTFSSGISFGDDTLSTYVDGTWTPAITAATTNPTLTYTSQSGAYWRIGSVVFYDALIVINTLSDGGSGEWRFSLPAITVGRTMVGTANVSGVDLPASTVSVYFRTPNSVQYGQVRATIDDGSTSILTGSNFASGDSIQYTGFYFV